MSDAEILSLVTDCFDEHGTPVDWIPVRDLMIQKGVLALIHVYKWYQHHNSSWPDQLTYVVALRHFEDELNTLPARKMRKRLDALLEKEKKREGGEKKTFIEIDA